MHIRKHIRGLDAAKELDAHHQANAGKVLDHGQLGQTSTQLDGPLTDIGQEALIHPIYHHIGTGADHRVAAKGGTVAAGAHALGGLFVQQNGTDGQAAAQALGQRDDIGLEVVVLTAQEGAGAAHAGLHLVHDEDKVLFITEGAHSLHILKLLNQLPDAIVEKNFYKVTDSNGKEYLSIKLKLRDILYFEYIKRSRKVLIALSDITYEYDCIFEKLVEELQPYDFVVNCRGNLVNLRHIEKIKDFIIYMDNGKELQIAQRRSNDFREEVNKFLQRNS